MVAQLGRFMLLAFLAVLIPAAASAGPLLFVDGRYVKAPVVGINGRTFVPARDVFGRLRAAVVTPSARELLIVRDGKIVARARIGTRAAIVRGRAVLLDGSPFRRGTRTFVPVQLVRDALGARIARTTRPAAVRIDGPAAAPPPRAAAAPQRARTETFTPVAAGPAAAANLLWLWVVLGVAVLALLAETARRTLGYRFDSLFKKRPVEDADAFGDNLFSDGSPIGPRIPVDGTSPRKLHLRAEELNIDKTTIPRGEARVHIEVITEEQTITVPLKRERLVIEYTGQSGAVTIDGVPLKAGEIVRIPLREEQVEVTKHTIVKEDVVIGKHSIEEQKHFHETLRREELRIEDSSDARAASLGG